VLQLHRFNLEYGTLYLHYYAFLPAVELLASEEQARKWLPLARSLGITGAYAQTELGHGSDVQNLQTTATYDPNSREFVFHTPSIQAIKFWPGGLGKSATHCVLYSRLITGGKDQGVQAFIVQVRDMQSNMPLPGIEVGDCGPKISFAATDNGYLKFTHFRQPISALLSRYVQIDPATGALTRDSNSVKLAYGGMLNLRIGIHHTSHYYIAKMATIATRYSFLRRQFENKDGGPKETPIMQYQMQQYKIVPAIAASWAHLITSNTLYRLYNTYVCELRATPRDDKKAFGLLTEIHCQVAGLKGMGSWHGEHFGELLKQSCGGHGYLQSSGLTKPHLDYGVGIVTAEGDNHVLMQQTSMILLKRLQEGSIDVGGAYELDPKLELEKQILLLFEMCYKGELRAVGLKISEELMGERAQDFKTVIWNEQCQVSLVNAGKYFIHYIVLKNFFDFLHGGALNNATRTLLHTKPETQALFRTLYKVYGGYWLSQDDANSFYQNLPSQEAVEYFYGGAAPSRVDLMLESFREGLVRVGMSARSVVEAFDFQDEELLSVLGTKKLTNEDQLYAEILRVVRLNPLNSKPVPRGWNRHMKPVILAKL
jgi:acyl-CoA oxidase